MIRIRPFIPTDEAKVLSWCGDEETWFRWTAGVLGEYPVTAERFQKTEELMRFAALDGTEIAGFFTLRNPGDSPEELRFGFVIVDPEKRGKGIGREMLRLGLIFAFHVYRAGRATLGVFEENEPARRCYRAAGFAETGVRETYTLRGRNHTALEMEASPPSD